MILLWLSYKINERKGEMNYEKKTGKDDSHGHVRNAASDKTITFWNVGTEGVDLGTYEMIIEKFNENNEAIS